MGLPVGSRPGLPFQQVPPPPRAPAYPASWLHSRGRGGFSSEESLGLSPDPYPARDVLSRFLLQFVSVGHYPRFQRRERGLAVRATQSGFGVPAL